MATPERRTAPSVPAHPVAATVPAGPVPVVRPVGWLVVLSAGLGIVLASWTLYGTDAAGMWAGYRGGFIGTIVVVCAMALNTSLPKQPILGLIGLCGIVLILSAVFIDQGRTVFLSEIIAGPAMLVGAGLYTAGR